MRLSLSVNVCVYTCVLVCVCVRVCSAFSFYQIRREMKLKINRKQNQKCKIQQQQPQATLGHVACQVENISQVFLHIYVVVIVVIAALHIYLLCEKTSRGKKKIEYNRGSKTEREGERSRRTDGGSVLCCLVFVQFHCLPRCCCRLNNKKA